MGTEYETFLAGLGLIFIKPAEVLMPHYKVRGKVFGVCGDKDGLTFKATEIAYAVLTEDGPGRPAPGFTPGKGGWVNLPLSEVSSEDAEDWLGTSYRLAAGSLTKKARAELGVA